MDTFALNQIHNVDALTLLRGLADESVHCIVTSPPYFGLRDYGVDGQIGGEETPEQYVAALVEVFHEARRVLRKDGTFWLNLGDSYVGATSNYAEGGSAGKNAKVSKKTLSGLPTGDRAERGCALHRNGLPMKSLLMMPARVALALQADGWLLRADIIWHKPNPMPESVKDRPTRSHEHVFLLTRSGRYFYDADAVKEDAVNGDPTAPRGSNGVLGQPNGGRRDKQAEVGKRTYSGFNDRWDARTEPLTKRNRRDVWTISPKPFRGAHFAVMPPDLVQICVLAGCPEGGIVCDPFMGSGTVARVALSLGRRYIGSDINPAYITLAYSTMPQMTLVEAIS